MQLFEKDCLEGALGSAGDDQGRKMIGVALGELDIGRRAGEHIIRMTGMDETEAEARTFQTRCTGQTGRA